MISCTSIPLKIIFHASRVISRWSQGLLFHQAMVDCARAAILLPLGSSILNCQPMTKCSLVETAFLLLVTVSTVNMLTTVLNDSPIFPETDEEADLAAPLLMDSPQASAFFFYSLSLLRLSHLVSTPRVSQKIFHTSWTSTPLETRLERIRFIIRRLFSFLFLFSYTFCYAREREFFKIS